MSQEPFYPVFREYLSLFDDNNYAFVLCVGIIDVLFGDPFVTNRRYYQRLCSEVSSF